MKHIIDSIRKSVDSRNYYSAIYVAITVPDICGYLETLNKVNNSRYKLWFQENLGKKYCPETQYDAMIIAIPNLDETYPPQVIERMKIEHIPDDVKFTPEKCWDLRNAILHSADSVGKKYSFILTHGGSHMNVINGKLQISIAVLCKDICDAYDSWYERVRHNPDILERIKTRVRIENIIMDGMVQIN